MDVISKYRWIILALCWLAYSTVFLNRLSVGPLAPFFKEEMQITNAQVGILTTAASLGFTLTLLPAGLVVDRIGARWPLAAGDLIVGISMIIMFFAPTYSWLLILMFIAGLGSGFLMPATTQSIALWFPQRERATVMGFKQNTANAAGIATAAILPPVALILGWRYGLLFLGVFAIAIGVLVIIFYKESSPPVNCSSSKISQAVPLLDILRNREVWLVGLCGLSFSWLFMSLVTYLVLYLKEELLFSVVVAGGLLAIVQVAGLIGSPGLGLASDRVFGGSRKSVFMAIAGITSALCLIVGVFGGDLSWAVYPVFIILGMVGLSFSGIYVTLLAEFGGSQGVGKATGLGTTVSAIGAALGPAVFGYIVDITGAYKWAWFSLSLVAAVSVLMSLLIREEKRKI